MMAIAPRPSSPLERLPLDGDELVTAFRAAYPEELAEVPFYVFASLARVADEVIVAARAQGNTPRRRIAEDGQHLARAQGPKR